MPRRATAITLEEGDYDYLRSLTKQRTIQAQVVIRAHTWNTIAPRRHRPPYRRGDTICE